MELLLNGIWLAIVCCAAAAALKRASRAESLSINRIGLFLAVVCFAALLFPSISITDDLQQVAVASEEVGRNLLKAAGDGRAPLPFAFLGILSVLLAAMDSAAGYLVCRSRTHRPSIAGFRFTILSRPPPALLS